MAHQKTAPKKISDYLGISSSILCLVHCLIFPFAMMGGGITIIQHEHHNHKEEELTMSELLMDYGWHLLFVVLAFFAAYRTIRQTHKPYIKVILILGWVFFTLGVWNWHGFMHIGSIALISGHLLNLRQPHDLSCEVH
jgi:hypothetical protein